MAVSKTIIIYHTQANFIVCSLFISWQVCPLVDILTKSLKFLHNGEAICIWNYQRPLLLILLVSFILNQSYGFEGLVNIPQHSGQRQRN